MTDVTGFSMIGHAREMALASNVALRFLLARHPYPARELSIAFAPAIFPAASITTAISPNAWSITADGVPQDLRTLLFDPQTAGGLLISVAAEDSAQLIQSLNAASSTSSENWRSRGPH